ncbi:putative uncharacterized protein DDB_G0282133 [Diabrotica virgifera virgifera]|uniref:Uncharacterized protein n=1 Tax=Diabrotica virgifera virgifera TaxID=50390 RepID=A0ABM5IZH3_DIAVI|nr:putative uncharacterized protein DDB_G0282133 [Diabrotica virgifera virgifera]
MIKLFLLAALGVVATFAAPQVVSSTAAPVAANDYYRNNYFGNNYDPYYRQGNNYDPYYRNGNYRNNYYRNQYDPYRRNNYYDNDYYRNNHRNNYYNNDYYNKNNYYNNDYYKNNQYNKNVYNTEYRKNYVAGSEANARILRFESNYNPEGGYEYAYETDNGIAAQQQGFPIAPPDSPPSIGVTGFFSYTSPEGQQVYTRYTADENGYRVEDNGLQGGAVVRQGVVPVNAVVESSTAASQK